MSENQGDWIPIRFIAEEIDVHFDIPPLATKKPDSPSEFTWEGDTYKVVDTISRWFTYDRKGRFAKNMRPHNLRKAERRGSWGVGRFYFRVITDRGQTFDLYYDRASEAAGDRKGHWFLWREMKPA
jgi:hypothetical protein